MFPVEDEVELEEECFDTTAMEDRGGTMVAVSGGGGAQWCSCAISDGMMSPELRRQSQVRERCSQFWQVARQGCQMSAHSKNFIGLSMGLNIISHLTWVGAKGVRTFQPYPDKVAPN